MTTCKSPKKKEQLNKKEFSAKDVKETAGISYRQIHTWDSKKALPKSSGGKSTWRKFTVRDVIKLTIISRLVDLGIPISRLKKLIAWMNRPQPDAVNWLISQMGYGFNMFLCTNLEDSFGFDTESEVYEIVLLIGDKTNKPTIVLPLNKIVNDVLEKLGLKGLEIDDQLRFFNLAKMMGAKNKKELAKAEEKIISLIRERQYQTVTARVKDGRIAHIKREESFPINQ